MKEKKEKPDQEYLKIKMVTKRLLSQADGRNFIWYVLSLCGIYSDVFTGNSQAFYLEGRRAVGLEVLQLLEDTDPTAYPNLLLKHAKEKEVDNA